MRTAVRRTLCSKRHNSSYSNCLKDICEACNYKNPLVYKCTPETQSNQAPSCDHLSASLFSPKALC